MKYLLFIVFAFGSGLIFSQTAKLKKADSHYNRLAYTEASTLYTELIGSEVDNSTLRAKLADCYYQVGEVTEAIKYYSQIEADLQGDDIYQYAQCFKEIGSYEKSDLWMEKFHQANATDSRGLAFNSNKEYLSIIQSQQPYFTTQHLSVNTANNEFGGYPSPTGVILVSDRKKRIAVQRYHLLNNKTFLDLFEGKVEEDGSIVSPGYLAGKANKKYHEGPVCYTQDGKTVYFTRNNMTIGRQRTDNNGIQNLKIYRANIDEEGAWKDIVELNINASSYSVGHPTLSNDGQWLFFSSDMPGGFGGADIYKAAIQENGTLGEPINLGDKINTEGQELFPWIDEQGMMFFSSDGHLGLGGLDVFAVITNKKGEFAKLINLAAPINSERDDFAFVYSAKNERGYISSNRDGGSGGDDIYSMTLVRPLQPKLQVQGVVTDLRSNEILPGATVQLLNTEGQVIQTAIADEQGGYLFNLEEDQDYKVAVSKDEYFDNAKSLSTKDLAAGTELIDHDMTLEKDPGLSIYALITDAKTQEPLSGVELKFTDQRSGEVIEVTTEDTGDFLKAINDRKLSESGSYTFELHREGYIPKTVQYDVVFDKEGQYDVHSALDLTMDPVVKDLRELVQINPINFDLGKWNIREDAKVELDKIVEVMNKYPNMVVELGSHTDCRASKSFNMRLSDKRAKSSAAYIQSKISNPERIYGKGYGESQLINDCECEGAVKSTCSEEEHEENRRTEFKIISIGE